MEQERVAAYLKVACTAMNFDIGEVWCYRMDQEGNGKPMGESERSKSMRFVQLHTSPNYDRMRDKLLTPKAVPNVEDLAEHRFSPAVCDAVREGREMFWATTEAGEGLLGRSDLQLRTAVGLPVCSIGYDLCILVLFANEKLASSPNFAQMLGKLSQAAAGMMSGALPASISSPIATGLEGISTGVAGAQDTSGGVLWQCPSHKSQPGSGQHAIVQAIRRNTAARNLCMKLITFGGGAGYKEAILYGGPKTAAAAAAAAGHQYSSGGSAFFLDEPYPTFHGSQSPVIEYDMDADDETSSIGSSASHSGKGKERSSTVGHKRPRSDSNVSTGSGSGSIGGMSRLSIPPSLGSGRMSPAGVSPSASPRGSDGGASSFLDLGDLSEGEMRKLLGPNGSPNPSAPNSVAGSVPGSPRHPTLGATATGAAATSMDESAPSAVDSSSSSVSDVTANTSANDGAGASGGEQAAAPPNAKGPAAAAADNSGTSSDIRDPRMDVSTHSVSSERSCSSNLTTGEQDGATWSLRVPAGGWANGGAQAVNGLDVSCTMSDLENLADLSDLDEQSIDGDPLRTLEVDGMEPAAKQARTGKSKRGHSPTRYNQGSGGQSSAQGGYSGAEGSMTTGPISGSLDQTMHGGSSIRGQVDVGMAGTDIDSLGGSNSGRPGDIDDDLGGMGDSGSMGPSMEDKQLTQEQTMHELAASRRKRFEEFMRGFLEMSIFEAADCWFSVPATTVTDANGNVTTEEAAIKHAFSVVRSQNLQPWAAYSAEITIPVGRGLPGLVIQNGTPVWEKALHRRPSHEHPRAPGAKALGICTAFGVPSADLGFGYSGAVCFYATASLDQSPIMVSFVENVIRCLSEEAAAETAQAASSAAPSMDVSRHSLSDSLNASVSGGQDITRTLTAENLAALDSTNHGGRRMHPNPASLGSMDSMPVGAMGGYTARQPFGGAGGAYDQMLHSQGGPPPGHGVGGSIAVGGAGNAPGSVGASAGADMLTSSMVRAVSATGSTGSTGAPVMYDGGVQGVVGGPMMYDGTPGAVGGQGMPVMYDGSMPGAVGNQGGIPGGVSGHGPMPPMSMGVGGVGMPSSTGSAAGYHTGYQGQQQHQQYQQQGRVLADPYPVNGVLYDGRSGGGGGVGAGGVGAGGVGGGGWSPPPTPGLVWQGQNDESAAVEALLMAGSGPGGSQLTGAKRRTRGRNSAYSDYDIGAGEVDIADITAGSGNSGRAPARDRAGRRTGAKRAKNGGKAAGDGADDADRKCCRMAGCNLPPSKRSPYCAEHMGARQCHHEGCNKCAQGSTKFCIAHGGGRRCTHPGCTRGARDKFFCAAHGGGKRCSEEGCNKSAVGGSSLCTAHGGGRRCKVPDCDKSAQSSTDFCVRHGGGRKCDVEGCEKVARGRTTKCAAHGGGVRCKLEGCNKAAVGRQQLCRLHSGTSVPKKRQVKQGAVAALTASSVGAGAGVAYPPPMPVGMNPGMNGMIDQSANMMDMGGAYQQHGQPW